LPVLEENTMQSVTSGATEGSWHGDPEIALMLRVRAGDHEAFQQLFDRHAEPLVNFIFRFVGTRERSEELAQEAFLRIYQTRERYEPRARFSTYLYRVAINLCLNETRRLDYQGRFEPLEGFPGADGEEGYRQIADGGQPTIEEELAGRQTWKRIQKALNDLPPNQKVALILGRCEGFSYPEVAETLGTTESAVKSLIFRATQTLREVLSDVVEDLAWHSPREGAGGAKRKKAA
jgi:RNA polymerase sigma-70 factor, ECF subfamily